MRWAKVMLLIIILSLGLFAYDGQQQRNLPDLIVKEIKCAPGNKLEFVVANIGPAPLPSGWVGKSHVWIGGRSLFDSIDLKSPISTTGGGIDMPGGTSTYSTPYVLTAPVTVRVETDYGNYIKEINEKNNTRTAKILPCEKIELPDLVVVNYKFEGRTVTFPPGTPIPIPRGSSRAVEISVQNSPMGGMVDVVGDFDVGLYLSTAPAGGCRPTPIRLWSATVSGLRAGESKRFSISVTFPASLTLGDYWMYPMVDDTFRIPERNEDGNCATSVALRIVEK
jgi:hypothetical protein